MLIRTLLAVAALVGGLTLPAAALTQRVLNGAGFHLVPGSPLPADAVLRYVHGTQTLGKALAGKPALLVFTDYRCQSLCGLILNQLAQTLPHVGLALGRDYNVISVALDPAQTVTDAVTFRDQHTQGSPLHDAGRFFTDGKDALAAMRASTGLVAPFDPEHHQFAHPAGLVLVDAKGRAQRIISPFAMDPLDLKLALLEGGAAANSLSARAVLLCYGWNATTGLYTIQVERILMIGAAATAGLLALAVGGMLYRERRTGRLT